MHLVVELFITWVVHGCMVITVVITHLVKVVGYIVKYVLVPIDSRRFLLLLNLEFACLSHREDTTTITSIVILIVVLS